MKDLAWMLKTKRINQEFNPFYYKCDYLNPHWKTGLTKLYVAKSIVKWQWKCRTIMCMPKKYAMYGNFVSSNFYLFMYY